VPGSNALGHELGESVQVALEGVGLPLPLMGRSFAPQMYVEFGISIAEVVIHMYHMQTILPQKIYQMLHFVPRKILGRIVFHILVPPISIIPKLIAKNPSTKWSSF
jgi:hypothetical protein